MASIAMMLGGAILNAAAFTGGNYLAKYLKLIRPLKPNTRATAPSFLTGSKPTEKSKNRRSRTSRTPITRSNSTTRRTRTSESRLPKNPSSLTSISQVSCRNRASCSLLASARSRSAMSRFVFFKLSRV